MKSSSQTYRPEIDGLRMIAVLAVIVYHIWPKSLTGGFLGVDVFFVISGYLISNLIWEQLKSGSFSFSDFYLRRVRRILPAQFIIVVLSVAGFSFLVSPNEMVAISASAFYSLFSVGNLYFYLESGYFGALDQVMPLLHLWSLAVEEQFYLVWPLALLALAMLKSVRLLALVIVGVGAVSLVASVLYFRADPPFVFYMFPFRIFEFTFGAALSVVPLRAVHRNIALTMSVVGCCLLVGSFLLITDTSAHPGFLTLIPCFATSLIIYGTSHERFVRQTLSWRPFVHLGLLSYSLYLVHWPVIVAARLLWGDRITPASGVALIGVSYILAVALHYGFERPLRYGQVWGKSFRPALLWIIGLMICGSIFYVAQIWTGAIRAASVTDAFAQVADAGSDAQCGDGINSVASFLSCPPDILIIGDSHAGRVGQALSLFSKEHEQGEGLLVRRWTVPGCPGLFGAYKIYDRPNLADRQEECREQIETWEQVIPHSTVQVVVLATRWAWLTERTRYLEDNIRDESLVTSEADPQTNRYSRGVFRASIEYTVQQLLNADKKVILFSQIPLLTENVFRCVSTKTDVAQALEECEFVPVDVARRRLAFSSNWFRRMANSDERIWNINLFSDFCDEQFCYPFLDGRLAYKDEDHLGDYGIEYLIENIFAPQMSNFMGR